MTDEKHDDIYDMQVILLDKEKTLPSDLVFVAAQQTMAQVSFQHMTEEKDPNGYIRQTYKNEQTCKPVAAVIVGRRRDAAMAKMREDVRLWELRAKEATERSHELRNNFEALKTTNTALTKERDGLNNARAMAESDRDSAVGRANRQEKQVGLLTKQLSTLKAKLGDERMAEILGEKPKET